jgi:hypothetical protein
LINSIRPFNQKQRKYSGKAAAYQNYVESSACCQLLAGFFALHFDPEGGGMALQNVVGFLQVGIFREIKFSILTAVGVAMPIYLFIILLSTRITRLLKDMRIIRIGE